MPQPPSDLPITIRSSPTWWQRIVPVAGAVEIEDPPLRAEPFPFGSIEMTELELYLARRAAGMRIETPAVRP